jgi:hypothetical protein
MVVEIFLIVKFGLSDWSSPSFCHWLIKIDPRAHKTSTPSGKIFKTLPGINPTNFLLLFGPIKAFWM